MKCYSLWTAERMKDLNLWCIIAWLTFNHASPAAIWSPWTRPLNLFSLGGAVYWPILYYTFTQVVIFKEWILLYYTSVCSTGYGTTEHVFGDPHVTLVLCWVRLSRSDEPSNVGLWEVGSFSKDLMENDKATTEVCRCLEKWDDLWVRVSEWEWLCKSVWVSDWVSVCEWMCESEWVRVGVQEWEWVCKSEWVSV